MPFTHHSHSGQFCGHAVSALEDVVKTAISKGMTTICLTEHIPRDRIDFYPEEEDVHTEESLVQLYEDFYHEARRLQNTYGDPNRDDRIDILVGFEGEWIRESSRTIIDNLMAKYKVDMFIGSVHHVHTYPIDFDTPMYHKAREAAGGSDEQVFADYFDDQLDMLKALKPPVVAHFDLIRLKSEDPERSFRSWQRVWEKIVRNLEFIAGYGGVLELNSSALRKGMSEPYPQVEICQEFIRMGGRFTLSDDSHGIEQVGLNYARVMESVKRAGITQLVCMVPKRRSQGDWSWQEDQAVPFRWEETAVTELDRHAFWKQAKDFTR